MRAKTFSGRTASQDADELAWFLKLLRAERVKAYGEVGARDGDTFHAVMTSLPKSTRGVALDLPGGAWGKGSTRSNLKRVISNLVAKGYDASAVFGDSTTPATIAQFGGRGRYDVIFIDGDHSLSGVTADWMNYRGLARLVAFHDIAGAESIDKKTKAPVEVPLLWEAIKREGHRTAEYLTPGAGMGIGVVWVRGGTS